MASAETETKVKAGLYFPSQYGSLIPFLIIAGIIVLLIFKAKGR